MAATVTPLPVKKPHSATRFSIDDILHSSNDQSDYGIISKKCDPDNKSHHANKKINNTDSLAAIDLREQLMKNMLSFDKLTDRRYSCFTEPPIINKGIKTSIIGSSEDLRDDLLLKERERFYEELALKLKIPPRITSALYKNNHQQKQEQQQGSPSKETCEKPSFLNECYKSRHADDATLSEVQRIAPSMTSLKYGDYDALHYRGSSNGTASTYLSTSVIPRNINEIESIESFGEYRARHFTPSPHRSLPALPLPPFPTSPLGSRKRLMKRSDFTTNIYSNSNNARYFPTSNYHRDSASHPYHYAPPTSNRYRYEFRNHNSPYDLNLSKCSYDNTTRQFNSKISSSNFSGSSPTSSTISPTLGDSPRLSLSPKKSPSRQCKGISDSGKI